jgi:acyl carrier protein
MVPTTLVALDRIPVNANGKADRSALLAAAARASSSGPPGGGSSGEPDADEVTLVTGEIWREILDVEHAAPEGDFLMLGGHSIKALRLLSRLDEELGAVIELVDFLDRPTLGRLVELVREAVADDAEVPDAHAE